MISERGTAFDQDEITLGGVADPNAQIDLGLPEEAPLRRLNIIPYDYQNQARTAFATWYPDTTQQEAAVLLATGMGKTITACLCLQQPLELGHRVLWVTHRNELLGQSAQALSDVLGVRVGVEKAERKSSYRDRVIIASIQTLKGTRLARFALAFQPDLIVFDEAHHGIARTWMRLKMLFSQAKVLNLTATPYRGDIGKRLELGTVLLERNTTDGIKHGFLVPPKPVGTIKLNLGTVKIKLGDYAPDTLSALMLSPIVLSGCVKAVLDNLAGRRCIVFAASVEHGNALAQRFRGAGIKRVYEVYGDTPSALREVHYAAVRNNPDSILINNLVLIEGFDLPALDFVAMFRPTKNAGLFLQCLGRGLRTCLATGKVDCLVLDAIDAQKRAVGHSDLVLPNDDDVQKAGAFEGGATTKLRLFLSWFYHDDDIEVLLGGGKVDEHARRRARTAREVFLALTPELDGRWLPSQLANQDKLQRCIDLNTDGDDPYAELVLLSGTRHVEAFVRVMSDGGWRYFPHRTLPKTPEENQALKDQFEEDFEDDGFTTEAISLNAIAELDPDLKNFLLNVLGEQNLAKQAAHYYDNFEVEGQIIAWFKPLNCGKAGFHFIQHRDPVSKANKFWIRMASGALLRVDVNGRNLNYRYSDKPVLSELPSFVKDVSWGHQRMSSGQLQHVRGILGIPEADLNAMQISKLSASALMSNHFGERTLRQLNGCLGKALEAMAQKRDCVL